LNTEHCEAIFKIHRTVNAAMSRVPTRSDARNVATAELGAVLEELGVPCEPPSDDGAHVADLVLPGPVLVEVRAASRPTISRLERLAAERDRSGSVAVLVADQLDPGVRKMLKDAGWGWLDRSGHIRIMAGAVQIDRAIPSLLGPDPSPADPLSRPTGIAVALELLSCEEVHTVRAIARASGVSVAAAHATITELRSIGLLSEGRPRHPDLFWAVADRWQVRWFALAKEPVTDVPPPTQALVRMQVDDLDLPGWAEVGDRAAQTFGARVAGESAPRFYLPDRRALTWALRTWGEASDDRAASSFVAVPPTAHATAQRFEVDGGWPCARPLVVALTLASDGSARSREVLADWKRLPEGLQRVW
jgi:hypothetical protein